jgi:hydroxylamine reductase
MGMFCYQCQETAKNSGCTIRGVCGKLDTTSNLQDLLLYALEGLAWTGAPIADKLEARYGVFIAKGLFATITNANFDEARIVALIREGVALRDEVGRKPGAAKAKAPGCATWVPPSSDSDLGSKAAEVGYLAIKDEDIRSLTGLVIFGLKGIAAYAEHAAVLGKTDPAVLSFFFEALAAVAEGRSKDELVALVLKTGGVAVQTMALLDAANTAAYGVPGITKVDIGVRKNPGILISGHDLRDLSDLLEQTAGTGVDVYTHSEMLPAHYYPAFKNYPHFAGNYGGSWWHQDKEFDSFNGAILMTTNCIVPVKDGYKNRIFTTGMAGYPGVAHIADRQEGGKKDFHAIIELAKKLPAPTELETGEIVGGFAHAQVEALADKIVAAVKAGKITRFVVMAGCDGRMKSREYFTDVAKALPKSAVILTAGCAKYRYNKLGLGDIDGIPRVLDAGQCNDSYSLAVTALKLKEIFAAKDVNDLPISFDIAWYEQKAVAVLLALLSLGFRNIRLGPTLPGFLSPNVGKLIIDTFGLKGTTTAEEDVAAMAVGQ